MIFSQKITERGKPDPSECMSFLTARNLVSRIHRICLPCRVFGSSSGHLRIVFGLFGQRYPADQKARRLWVSGYEIGCARIGEITVPMDKGNVGSGEEKDSKCHQDPSGRPARVVKRWGLHHPFRGHIEWKFISHFTKNNLANEVHYESQFKSERVYFTRKKRVKAQIPFITHWQFAMFALINCSS